MPQDAILCYQRALQTKPDYAMAFGELSFCNFSLYTHFLREMKCEIAQVDT